MNDLIIGLLSGAILASGTFTLRNWRRKARLKQPWIQLQGKSDQLSLENQELRQQLTLEAERGQSLRQQLAEQQQQFRAQQQVLEELQQQLKTEEARSQKLSQDLDKAWKEAEQILDSDQAEAQQRQAQLKALQEEREDLSRHIHTLEADLAAADDRLIDQAHRLEEAQTRLQTGTIDEEQFVQAIAHLLPNIEFLRNSVDVMMQEPPARLNALLSTLRALSDGSLAQNRQSNGVKVMKVHATDNRWSECHVPRANMMRVYFQKSRQGDRYQVLVTEKKNEKTQGKNHAWLKSQPVN